MACKEFIPVKSCYPLTIPGYFLTCITFNNGWNSFIICQNSCFRISFEGHILPPDVRPGDIGPYVGGLSTHMKEFLCSTLDFSPSPFPIAIHIVIVDIWRDWWMCNRIILLAFSLLGCPISTIARFVALLKRVYTIWYLLYNIPVPCSMLYCTQRQWKV